MSAKLSIVILLVSIVAPLARTQLQQGVSIPCTNEGALIDTSQHIPGEIPKCIKCVCRNQVVECIKVDPDCIDSFQSNLKRARSITTKQPITTTTTARPKTSTLATSIRPTTTTTTPTPAIRSSTWNPAHYDEDGRLRMLLDPNPTWSPTTAKNPFDYDADTTTASSDDFEDTTDEDNNSDSQASSDEQTQEATTTTTTPTTTTTTAAPSTTIATSTIRPPSTTSNHFIRQSTSRPPLSTGPTTTTLRPTSTTFTTTTTAAPSTTTSSPPRPTTPTTAAPTTTTTTTTTEATTTSTTTTLTSTSTSHPRPYRNKVISPVIQKKKPYKTVSKIEYYDDNGLDAQGVTVDEDYRSSKHWLNDISFPLALVIIFLTILILVCYLICLVFEIVGSSREVVKKPVIRSPAKEILENYCFDV